ncbi:MAG: hypothetical protein IJK96_03325 [Bacteroidales bacterium]|nr:hypothetical protein [Bacteroidales bacterium]
MKRIIYILSILSLGLLASCQKDPIGETSCVDMSGQWYVTCDAFAGGEVVYEDPFGLGQFIILTSNTAKDIPTEMMLSDLRDDSFWNFKCKIVVDPATMTFFATDSENFEYEDCTATVTGGKIIKGGAVTPSGMPVDYIEFHILFSDDGNAAAGYWEDFYVHGYRYTGFKNDD